MRWTWYRFGVRAAHRIALALVPASLGCLALPALATAHGRPTQLERLALDPDDPDRLVLQTSFGVVESEDRGATWRWVCAAAYRADPTFEDPVITIAGGSLVIGTFDGVAVSAAPRCEWLFPEGPVRDVYMVDVEADPSVSGRVWGVASDGRVPDRVVRSDDAGHTWSLVGPPIEEILIESIARAPSDPERLYLAGAVSEGTAPRLGFVLRSEDGGETLETLEIALDATERFPWVVAVDPTNADRLLVRVVRRLTVETPERLLVSEDGGRSFEEVLTLPRMNGVALSDDGRTLFVGSALGGLYRAEGGTFELERVSDVRVRCLVARGEELWICADQSFDGFALGRSLDGGASIEPRFWLDRVDELPACEVCSTTGFVCPAWLDDLRADQATYFGDGGMPSFGLPRDAGDIALCGLDGGLGGGLDGGAGVPAAPRCGCSAPGRASGGLPLLALALLGRQCSYGLRRARRARHREASA